MLGRKVLRFCFVRGRQVLCDGLCHVTLSVVNDNGAKSVRICPVEEEALDLVLNH